MDNITDLYPYIMIDVPGAPDNIVRLQTIQALREFCMDTEIWTETVVMDAVDGQSEYDISLTNEASIQRVLHIKTKTSASQEFDDIYPISATRYKLSNDGNSIVFYNNNEPSVSLTDGIEFKFALRPSITTEELSGDILDRYGDGIASLVRYKLMMTPQTPYYNPDLAQFHYNQYRNTRATALREKIVENKNEDMYITQLGGIL